MSSKMDDHRFLLTPASVPLGLPRIHGDLSFRVGQTQVLLILKFPHDLIEQNQIVCMQKEIKHVSSTNHSLHRLKKRQSILKKSQGNHDN